MGRVINLHPIRQRQRAVAKTATPTSAPETSLSIALSESVEARRQIGALLEAITQVEQLTESIADKDSCQALLCELWDSRRNLLVSLKHVSTTIDLLSSAVPGEHPVVDGKSGSISPWLRGPTHVLDC